MESSSGSSNPVPRLLEEALRIQDPVEREKYLEQACAGDPVLLEDVKSLLSFAEALEGISEEEPSFVGQQLGKYEIKSLIGHGGMGDVYLGVRTQDFNRRVAIKLIKRTVATPDSIKRFSREVRLQAGLSHPNIAKLIDCGVTEDKLPYFVMEYVEGQRIDEYCDANKLSIRERFELFLKVCTVIQYLHNQGVVHRDIKPNNIMVTSEKEPVLLDFGIAKVLNPDLATGTINPTNVLQRAFSADYASPEQVRGDQVINKTSDIYSLGAVLYELMTGHRPHRFSSRDFEEVKRVITTVEPIKPSKVIFLEEEHPDSDKLHNRLTAETVSAARYSQPKALQRLLSGDIDSIILKAMRKEPMRRYADVESLITDINNHLNYKPISARRGTWKYHSEKLISRMIANLPPVDMAWQRKILIYLGLFLILCTLVVFPRIKKWGLVTYYMATLEQGDSLTIYLSNEQKQKSDKAVSILTEQLSTEVKLRQRNPNAWTMSQMAIGLEGLSSVDRRSVDEFLTGKMDAQCHCWREGQDSPRDLRVSSWVILGMSRIGLAASDEQINFLIDNMSADGWWPTYTRYPADQGHSVDPQYASTYATSMAVLALEGQSRLQSANPNKYERIKDAITRGRAWLLRTRVPGRARWWDYPFNKNKTEAIGISGVVLHTIHHISMNQSELNDIDQLWLQELPDVQLDAKAREVSVVVIDAYNLRDPSSHFPLQWSIVATVDAYHSGTLREKAEANVWIDRITGNIDSLAEDFAGEMDWGAAELLIAIRHLRGEKII